MKSFTCFFYGGRLILILLPEKGFIQNISLLTRATGAANLLPGIKTNPIAYAVKMNTGASGITINSIPFTLPGTRYNNDTGSIEILINSTAPASE